LVQQGIRDIPLDRTCILKFDIWVDLLIRGLFYQPHKIY